MISGVMDFPVEDNKESPIFTESLTSLTYSSTTMYDPPYMFSCALSSGHSFKDGTDPRLQDFKTLNDAPKDLLPSLTVNVSGPNPLLAWLDNNDASLITDLFFFLYPFRPHTAKEWTPLFDKLSREATNIQTLSIYFDADGPWGTKPPWDIEDQIHYGMGQSVVFIQGIARLKVHKSLEIEGFYAMHWPAYLAEQIGLKPIVKELPYTDYARALRDYQVGTDKLDPWTQTKDVRHAFDLNPWD